MAFPPAFLDELKARTSLSQIVGQRVALKRAGRGEFTGLCPFHNEKTPSFTVSEDKGFYHCFGCGAHGSAIDFVVETEGLSFSEAVEKLSATAGLEVPKRTEADAQKAQKVMGLQEAVEKACLYFESLLKSKAGREGLTYLRHRGLSPQTITAFRLGWAPNGWRTLKQFLMSEGFSEETLREAGLLKQPDGGGESYDFFRERIMFPVADRKGRIIAFGGRILGDGAAKYINSPDGPLFSKGRLLFNLSKARPAAREKEQLVVVEGYMDVIALAHAGFHQAVAPLGTAVTEDQIREMWRLTPEPILCFDGDNAGRRAAFRAAERAWPLLTPGQSLRFCFLPDGEDPDSLVRRQGRQPFEALLHKALPMADFMWNSLLEATPLETPEQKAAFRITVENRVLMIEDRLVQTAYRDEFKSRVGAHFGRVGFSQNPESYKKSPDTMTLEREKRAFSAALMAGFRDRKSYRAKPISALNRCKNDTIFSYGYSLGWDHGVGRIPPNSDEAYRNYRATAAGSSMLETLQTLESSGEKSLLTCAINHPWMLVEDVETFAHLELHNTSLAGLQHALIGILSDNPDLTENEVKTILTESGYQSSLDAMLSETVYLHAHFARPNIDPETVREGWQDLITQLSKRHDERMIDLEATGEDLTEQTLQRLQALYCPSENS